MNTNNIIILYKFTKLIFTNNLVQVIFTQIRQRSFRNICFINVISDSIISELFKITQDSKSGPYKSGERLFSSMFS